MKTMDQERKDLVVLVADGHQEQTVATLLAKRYPSLGIRDINFDIYTHSNSDPGVFHEAGDFLSISAQRYQHALVVIDAEWSGSPENAEEIETKIQNDLNRKGWEGRSAVIVINPELEIWVWSTSPHVPRLFGTDWEMIKDLAHQTGCWQAGAIKPSRPKDLLDKVLHRTRRPRSSALYRQLAGTVGLRGCQDSSFLRFREILQEWFPDKDRHPKRRI